MTRPTKVTRQVRAEAPDLSSFPYTLLPSSFNKCLGPIQSRTLCKGPARFWDSPCPPTTNCSGLNDDLPKGYAQVLWMYLKGKVLCRYDDIKNLEMRF